MKRGPTDLAAMVLAAQGGRDDVRQDLLEDYRPFIVDVASTCCRRVLHWENDDELSVALSAFNEAIDSYRSDGGAGFLGFSRAVIRRRLVDHFRRERRHVAGRMPLDGSAGDPEIEAIHASVAWREYERERERSERLDDIALFGQRLAGFGLTLEQVADASPVHRDTRQNLERAAKELARDEELMEYLRDTGRLPQRVLSRRLGLSSRVLTRGRPYIIALTLVLTSDDMPYLKDYFSDRGDES